MKIAQVTHSFPPYMSGTGNACYHYAIELAKLGHDVTVFTYDYPKQPYKYPDIIKVKKLPYLFRVGNAAFMPGLLKELKGFDIIHLHFPFFFGAEMVYLASKLQHTKYIITYHNDAISKGLIGLYFTMYRHTIMKLILSGSSAITVSSLDYGRHSLIKRWIDHKDGKGIEIPFGVDTERFNTNVDCSKIKTKYGLNDKKVVLFVGGLDKPHYFKGVEYLIKGFAKVKNDNARLMIVGNGDLKEHFVKIAENEYIKDKTIFVGGVSDTDLPAFYALSNIVVLPSISIESFGLVLLEAMATGKPVIASDLPGVRTVVDNGKTGFLVPPKDVDTLALSINRLLNDDSISNLFGENGLRKVKTKYSWSVVGKQLETVLHNIK